MCTAVAYKTKERYFGRNLDLDYSYNEEIIVTPGKYPFKFRCTEEIKNHYGMIGMGVTESGYPLYYDAVNEKGLAMAGLSFNNELEYREYSEDKDNIAPFEFIPWVLSQCETIEQVKKLLGKINIVNMNFNEKYTISPLHWMISDGENSLTVESVKEGIKVYDNPVGVLTNDPGFDMQMFNLNNYMGITTEKPKNRFSEKVELEAYCKGMGAIGLPGDLSSMSRFVKAVFTKLNSVSGEGESESISQFFHILSSVYQQRGCVKTGKNKYEITCYSSCCNLDKGIYYYTTYENSQITAVDMRKTDMQSNEMVIYQLVKGQQINYLN